MAKVTINDLLEAGVHFGHQTKRWNPKMKHFVYGAKNGISIIDLTKTIHQIADACNFVQRTVGNGGKVLFVGTKRQAQQLIRETAEKHGMYFVTERWLGGTLTNNVTIRKSISKMQEIDELTANPGTSSMKKKELSLLARKGEKLHLDLDGIKDMKKLPDLLVIVDVCHDNIAVREAVKLGIPMVAIVDTNGDPNDIDYPIAANDDAVKSIKIIIDTISDAIGIASEIYQKKVSEEKAKAAEEKAAREADAKEKREKKAREAKEHKPAPVAAAKAKKEEGAPVEKKKLPPKAKKEDAPVAEKAEVKVEAKLEDKDSKEAAEKKKTAKKPAVAPKKKKDESKAEDKAE